MKPKIYQIIYFVFVIFICPFSIHGQDLKTEIDNFSDLQIEYFDKYIIPHNLKFENTTVGGLSGIDYNPQANEYYVVSDDGNQKSPARFYTIKIEIKSDTISKVIITGKTLFKTTKGEAFPRSQPGIITVDPEALRYYDGNFIWSSEGKRNLTGKVKQISNPRIFISDQNGRVLDTLKLPEQVIPGGQNQGIRVNGSFEGLDFSTDRKYLFVSIEEPLLQDGPPAGIKDSSAIVRILKFDMASRSPIAQYAYEIDPVAHPPFPKTALRINGISDILTIGKDKLLVVERGYSFPRLSFNVKVYLADLVNAEDVTQYQSLKGKEIRLVSKRLLLDMDQLGLRIDNVEGVSLGTKLSNGNPSLIFITDDNFRSIEETQILLFELKTNKAD